MPTDIAIVPDTRPDMHRVLADAVRDGGGQPSGLATATALRLLPGRARTRR